MASSTDASQLGGSSSADASQLGGDPFSEEGELTVPAVVTQGQSGVGGVQAYTEFVIRSLSGQIVGMWKDPQLGNEVVRCLAAALHCPSWTLILMDAEHKKITWHDDTMCFGPMTVITTEAPSGPAFLTNLQLLGVPYGGHLPRVWVLGDVSGDVMQPFGVTPPFSGALTVRQLCGMVGWLVAELKTPGGAVLLPSMQIGRFGTVLYASRVLSPPEAPMSLGESREFCDDDLLDVSTPRSDGSP